MVHVERSAMNGASTHRSSLTIKNQCAFGLSSALDAPAIAGMPWGNSPLLGAVVPAFALSPIVATQKMNATIIQKKKVHKDMIPDA
jgi:hypothetical protein